MGNEPNFRGDGLTVWVNTIRDGEHKGQQYLSIQLFGRNGIKVNCFKNIKKDVTTSDSSIVL